jgi:hypothetical protein
MECPNCRNKVVIRHEREGIIHENGLYACYGQEEIQSQPGKYKSVRLDTVAEVRDHAAEERLRIAANIKRGEDEVAHRPLRTLEEVLDD